jgi:hypothetical protein
MMNGMTNLNTYREVQKMNRVLWVMLIIYGVTALIWWGFISQIILGEPWGTNPSPDWLMWLLWLSIGIGLPIFFNTMRLIVEVRSEEVFIRYAPIHTRLIALAEISQVEAREYSPIREYGGWGIRGWSSKTTAYNVTGNQGVELTLLDGRKVMIGSQKHESLANAIIASMRQVGLHPN